MYVNDIIILLYSVTESFVRKLNSNDAYFEVNL